MTGSTSMPRPSHALLDALWTDYAADVPYVSTFVSLCQETGGDAGFENDHIALRTLARDREGIAGTAAIFERLGWKQGGDYVFPDMKLRAVHLSQPGLPRIFISELHTESFPVDVQAALLRLPGAPAFDATRAAQWFVAPSPPARADVELVERVSQYGAWLLCFGRRVNHFTARVDDVASWQARLLAAGVPMKSEIEGAVGSDLRQTATHAAPLLVQMADGSTRTMPYAYFEIAERHRGFDGFLGPQARQLFDMTKPT